MSVHAEIRIYVEFYGVVSYVEIRESHDNDGIYTISRLIRRNFARLVKPREPKV